MDLQSGRFYWPTTLEQTPIYPPLSGDTSCDVLIVGGGISGALSAWALAQHGADVLVVDKRQPGSGSTTSNTGLIQYAGGKSFVKMVNTFGEERTVRHLKLCEAAIHNMEALSSELPINPDFTRRDSLYYASYPEDVAKLEQEITLLKKHGFQAILLSEEHIAAQYPFRKPGAIYYYNDADLNPVRFTAGLLEKARSSGVRVHANTEITGKTFEHGKAVFYTQNRHRIEARYVIFAAGYENLEVKRDKNAVLSSTYAVVTQPIADLSFWYKRTLIWETARPYMYMRTTADNRVIIGGLDKDTEYADVRDSKLLNNKDKLLGEFGKLFPDIPVKAEYYLAAFYGGTHDGLPMIGMYEEFPGCYFLMGYGDNGIVYSMVLAEIIGDMIATGRSKNADLYLQTRPKPFDKRRKG
ncbi:FAD-binding oxidoreductase [Paenibacillus sp. KQZ6P-2]|uniref:FAD-binding oxidoreductase n=1 Tax=Paenibacillus mangrovi TaxID=2931978 RepID=A0A9X2B3D1_9BACL|nr:FAD-dependent oxidoreductase [Paenibacillus mangrovi]MCJ8012855.1 FAD-binding oxidoreductase [Paenibacillus mangrovi]